MEVDYLRVSYEPSIRFDKRGEITNGKALADVVFMLKPGPLDERNIADFVEECEMRLVVSSCYVSPRRGMFRFIVFQTTAKHLHIPTPLFSISLRIQNHGRR